MRIVIGNASLPPLRHRYRPTCVISWFKDGYENASYCISTTGRHPARQSPTAAPSSPASASGVSTQRCGPKRSSRPAVARKTPPARPTSSPSTITSASRSSSVWRASLTASTSRSSATTDVPGRLDVDVREQELRIARRFGLGGGDAGAHQLLGLTARLLGALRRQHALLGQQALEAREALVRARLVDAGLVDVGARVVRGCMRRGAVVHRLDQRRAAAGAVDRVARGLLDREHVEAVDGDAGDAVADRLVGERAGLRLRLERRRDRPAV